MSPSPSPTAPAAAARLVTCCRDLAAAGLSPGASGNVSVREVDDQLLITASGSRFDALSDADLVRVDADGATLAGAGVPSSELDLHQEIYRRRPDVGAVVHTHGRHAVALSTLVTRVPALHYYCVLLGGPPVVAPYRTYGTPDLARTTVAALGDAGAVVMAHHGSVTVGPDLATARERAEVLEWLCEVALLAMSAAAPAGRSPAELSVADLDAVVARRQSGGTR